MGLPYSILSTDQHGQNTEFFSRKYGNPYIDLNRLEKNFGSVFFAFRAVLFYLYCFKFFRFSVFLGQLLRYRHIVHISKLDKDKNFMLFSKKYEFSVFTTRYGFFPCSILNTDQHGQNTEFFSLKYGSPYIHLNRLEKNFGCVFFAFCAVLFDLYIFFKKNSIFCVFRAIGILYLTPKYQPPK